MVLGGYPLKPQPAPGCMVHTREDKAVVAGGSCFGKGGFDSY